MYIYGFVDLDSRASTPNHIKFVCCNICFSSNNIEAFWKKKLSLHAYTSGRLFLIASLILDNKLVMIIKFISFCKNQIYDHVTLQQDDFWAKYCHKWNNITNLSQNVFSVQNRRVLKWDNIFTRDTYKCIRYIFNM